MKRLHWKPTEFLFARKVLWKCLRYSLLLQMFEPWAYLGGSLTGSIPTPEMNTLLIKRLKLYENTYNQIQCKTPLKYCLGYIPGLNAELLYKRNANIIHWFKIYIALRQGNYSEVPKLHPWQKGKFSNVWVHDYSKEPHLASNNNIIKLIQYKHILNHHR